MANHKSAKKRIRQIARRTDVNRDRRGRIRSYVRKVEEAIASGDKGSAEQAIRSAMPEMQSGAQHGLTHRNTVARKISRLTKRIKAL